MERYMEKFSMQDVLKLPQGVVKEYATPQTDRTGSLKLVIGETFGVIDGTMITDKPTAPLSHYNDRPFVEMNFMLEGNISQTYDGLLDRHHYARGYHNILFNPYSLEKNQLMNSGRHRIFSAHIFPERMVQLFAGYIPELSRLAEKIDRGEAFVVHAPVNGMNNQLKYCFDSFWDCPAPMSLRKLYFEAKILDLLCRQAEHLVAPQQKHGSMAAADLEKVYYARQVILDNLTMPPSLMELSRVCGLNEFKLKKYFREIHGNSVFGFLQEERLKLAKQWIYQGEKNISTIAYELGYSHPQHFQRTFKKRFGVTPKSLLK
jgi:AraC family transcriptional activator of pyochelin receptor